MEVVGLNTASVALKSDTARLYVRRGRQYVTCVTLQLQIYKK